MKKALSIIGMILLLGISIVFAHEHDFSETKQLIDSGISCDKLTDEQLEAMGDYYMEQMHPGEQHELMDKMMGGEGSESLRQMHIQMGEGLYCGESSGMMGGGMMGMMQMMMNTGEGNMMSGQNLQANMMQGMMGNWGYSGYLNFLNVLYAILLIGLIILICLGIIKLWRDLFQKKRR